MKMNHPDSQLKSRKTVGENRQSIGVFRGKRKGMTLIEVVVSLALFSILAIPVAGLVNGSISLNKKAEVKQQATLLGQSILEELASVDKLLVGINNLFGKGDVEILGADSCDESQYCIKELMKNEFNINLNFNFLSENKDDELESFSIQSLLNEQTEEPNLYIEFSNNSIDVKIQKILSSLNVKDKTQVSIFIDSSNKVSLQVTSKNNKVSSYALDEELTNGKIFIKMKTKNQNHAVKEIAIHNDGTFVLQGCLENKDAGGHELISKVKVIPENKGYIKVLTDNDKCAFSEDNGSNPISLQVTNSFDLFEIDLSVYKKDSTDLLFKGTRVLPLKFE